MRFSEIRFIHSVRTPGGKEAMYLGPGDGCALEEVGDWVTITAEGKPTRRTPRTNVAWVTAAPPTEAETAGKLFDQGLITKAEQAAILMAPKKGRNR